MLPKFSFVIGGVGSLLATSIVQAGSPTFTGLGDLPGGNTLSAAMGVNADGTVVVGYSHTSHGGTMGNEAFRWTAATGLVAIGELPGGGFESIARAVSADGTIIVGDSLTMAAGQNADHGFRWTQATGMIDIGDLPGGDSFSIASGISADGNVIGGHSSSSNSGTLSAEAFRKIGAAALDGLGDLPGGGNFFSVANGVSSDGSFIAGYGTSASSGPSSSEAFRYNASTDSLQPIGDLPGGGFGSNAFGINGDGTVVVGLSAAIGGVFAFRWTDPASGGNGMQSIGDLPGGSAFSRANGVSGDGNIVVGQSIGMTNAMEAFVWRSGEGIFSVKQLLIDAGIDMTGWTLEVATAISIDGTTIVGYGPHNGNYEGWVARFPSDAVKGDVDGDGDVDIDDLFAVIAAWGPCPNCDLIVCEADLDADCDVDIDDLFIVIANWS